jgi:hypothetical protein
LSGRQRANYYQKGIVSIGGGEGEGKISRDPHGIRCHLEKPHPIYSRFLPHGKFIHFPLLRVPGTTLNGKIFFFFFLVTEKA